MFYAFIILVVVAVIASWPLEPEINLLAGMASVILLSILPVSRKSQTMRAVAAAIGVVIATRYMWWRWSETIPTDGGWFEIFLSISLALAETFGLWSLFSGAFIGARPLKRGVKEPGGAPETWPTVDIFIPTYNEPWFVVGPTVAAACAMDYPRERFNVWLLDDGGTDQRLADEDDAKAQSARLRREAFSAHAHALGAGYITRAENKGAKAGNINNAIIQTDGEVILVLDSDHTPTKDFLKSTVGWIQSDPEVGLVQTPHFFTNPDPIQKNLGLQDRAPAENDMFYFSMLQGADYHGSTFWCGSAALIRRAALVEIGGVSERTVTEDADTSFSMMAAGWKTAYVEKPMVGGLQPYTIDAFTVQRSRWSIGMMQILFKAPPFLRSGLSAAQRVCLSAFCMHWLFPFARLAFIFGPTFYLLFGLEIFRATTMEMIAYGLPHFIISQIINHKLYGDVRGPFLGEIHDTAMAPFLAGAMLKSLFSGKASFAVTSKEEGDRSYVSHRIGTMAAMFFYLAASALVGWFAFANGGRNEDALVLCTVWTVWNLTLVAAAMGLFRDRFQGPARARACAVAGSLSPIETRSASTADSIALEGVNGVNGADVSIVGMSDGALTLRPTGVLRLANDTDANLTCATGVMKGRVRHIDGGMANFEVDIEDHASLSAHTALLFGDSTPWIAALDIHKRRMTLVGGLAMFVGAALYGLFGGGRGDAASNRRAAVKNRENRAPIKVRTADGQSDGHTAHGGLFVSPQAIPHLVENRKALS